MAEQQMGLFGGEGRWTARPAQTGQMGLGYDFHQWAGGASDQPQVVGDPLMKAFQNGLHCGLRKRIEVNWDRHSSDWSRSVFGELHLPRVGQAHDFQQKVAQVRSLLFVLAVTLLRADGGVKCFRIVIVVCEVCLLFSVRLHGSFGWGFFSIWVVEAVVIYDIVLVKSVDQVMFGMMQANLPVCSKSCTNHRVDCIDSILEGRHYKWRGCVDGRW
ncbi:unnamed protein product [Clonostachys solani]|uniref:Uncharacterized protein n=1 Tax=Clonostachys solani TaxID=160281 RepID=A0A9N9VUY9_9HYPO|nr:unnamed protein product [Clonostachys solani]